ncbi:ATP-binding protein [Methylobacterium sp. Leaf466]|uniref:ATP-binding protein n=1 Tax=Methylobacterium sp. Leaf466 TaxID=1736386 RepID=UPI0006F9E3BD|nr:ATP-binding protein [Methylobacterium sp. Leaf466]KQT84246.1 hypothetical protein ASG59_02290 [Methylobacterium sp. Leaf466]
MSNREQREDRDGGADALGVVLARWADDRRLGPFLAAPGCALLILDAAAEAILHASEAAAPLRAGLAGAGDRIDPAVGLKAQVGRIGLSGDGPALARLQFDRRRIQPSATCLVVRADGEGGPVIALIVTGRLPRLRPAAEAPVGRRVVPPAAQPEPEAEPTIPAEGPARFTWRSDGEDRLGAIAGPAGALVQSAMLGASWQGLAESRVLTDAEGLLAALAQQRTFRAISLVLRRPGSPARFEMELSGTPLARAGQPFSGYGGFGLLRPLPVDERPAEPLDDPAPQASDPVTEPAVSVIADGPTPPPADEPVEIGAVASDPHLSGDEHDAFREIARALGARFAGDEPDRTAERRDGPGGDVMPFPAPVPRAPEPDAPGDEARADPIAILVRLPAAVLVCRAGHPIFANPTMLTLAGFADIDGLVAAGGLARLFHGRPPEDLARVESPALLFRREGGSVGVSVSRCEIPWQGGSAELLLIREVAAEAPDVALAAARVAQDFAGRRSAEVLAVLDSLDDGVVTLDAAGRILGVNRPAARLLGLDAREVVGAGVASLLSGVAHRPGARVPDGAEPRQVVVEGANGPLTLQMRRVPLSGAGERRSLLLLRAMQTEAEPDRAAAGLKSEILAKINHEVRPPLDGILGFTDAMLTEQFGPLENERYRECLHDIRASGEHVLAVVKDLADLASLEAGRRDLAFTEVPLNDIVSSCVAMMLPQAARDRIVIRTSFSENLTRLVADEPSVRQAALNVIANAIRFTQAGGQVIVSTTMADRGEIALRVRDTGVGMTPDEVETVLEPYRKTAAPTPRGSTGLGLPLTKALVEANRGRLRITSHKDEGTLVEMLFPPALSA